MHIIRVTWKKYGRKYRRLHLAVEGVDEVYVEIEPAEDKWYLSLLFVAVGHRRKGYAAALMNAVCALADAENVVMDMIVTSLDIRFGMCDDSLIQFYQRYGFSDMGAAMMARFPNNGTYNGYTSIIDSRSLT